MRSRAIVVGAILGIFATLGHIVRQRRQIAMLRRELETERGRDVAIVRPDVVER